MNNLKNPRLTLDDGLIRRDAIKLQEMIDSIPPGQKLNEDKMTSLRLTAEELAALGFIKSGDTYKKAISGLTTPDKAPGRQRVCSTKVATEIGGKYCYFDSLTELKYAGHLEMLKRSGKIEDWWHHDIKLKLAEKTELARSSWWTPDFSVKFHGTAMIQLEEVKGMRITPEAKRVFKMAKQLHQTKYYEIIMVQFNGRSFKRVM